MGNPYNPHGVMVRLNRHDLWCVTRAGRFVAAFPRAHFETEADVRNVLKLMSRAFDFGVESAKNRQPIEAL